MKYSKKHSIICFSRDELSRIFEIAKKKELQEEMKKRGISYDILRADPALMEDIASTVGERGAQHRDEHEVFAGLFMFLDFYTPGSDVCFEVSGFNPGRDRIDTLGDLIRFRHQVNTSDFCILGDDGLRKFELKRYRGGMNIPELSEVLKEKVQHYGNDLGETTLLVVFQPPAYTTSDLDFHELHGILKASNWKFPGEIRVVYNHNNQKRVMIQVYPHLSKSEAPMRN